MVTIFSCVCVCGGGSLPPQNRKKKHSKNKKQTNRKRLTLYPFQCMDDVPIY